MRVLREKPTNQRASISKWENVRKDRLASIGIHLRVRISEHLKVVSVEISVFTRIRRMVMTGRKKSGAFAIQIQNAKDFMLALTNTKRSKVLLSTTKTAGIPKTSRKFKVRIDPVPKGENAGLGGKKKLGRVSHWKGFLRWLHEQKGGGFRCSANLPQTGTSSCLTCSLYTVLRSSHSIRRPSSSVKPFVSGPSCSLRWNAHLFRLTN